MARSRRRRGRRRGSTRLGFNPARAFLAFRAFRRQMKMQGSGDMLSMTVAAVVAWRTYQAAKREQQQAEKGERTTLREVLGA